MTLIRNDTQAEVENMQAGDIDMQKIELEAKILQK